MVMPVREERTGWRDQRISARHREWGCACAAVDLDFLVVEYNFGKPVALVEYKNHRAEMPNLNHYNYRALTELADCTEIPLLLVFYWPNIWAFQVFPVNEYAKNRFKWGERFNEIEFVKMLYNLRDRVLKIVIEEKLNTEYPPSNSDYSLDAGDDNPFS